MYYSSYTNETIITTSILNNYEFFYNMKMAYLLTFSAYFLVFFLVIAIRCVLSYR